MNIKVPTKKCIVKSIRHFRFNLLATSAYQSKLFETKSYFYFMNLIRRATGLRTKYFERFLFVQ